MNNSIPQSVAEFYQLAKDQGITLPRDLSIYQQVRLFVARTHPDNMDSWPEIEALFIGKIMRGAPEPVEDAGDMIA